MVINRVQLFITTILLIVKLNHSVYSLTVKDIFTPQIGSGTNLLAIIRVPRDTVQQEINNQEITNTVVRKARDSKYYATPNNYKETDRADRSLKPEDNTEDDRGTKSGGTALGKRCITCDGGYLRSSSPYDRNRDRYDRYYDRDPYSSSSRSRYDPYDRYDSRDSRYGYYDNNDYDRDTRGRNRYSYSSSYDRYDPRDRYSERGVGYDNRGYDYRDIYYSPYNRDRYDTYSPYDDYNSRGYDSYSSRGYGGRPDYQGNGDYYGNGGYGRGYNYLDRDRYGGSGSGYGSSSYGGGYGNGYGSEYGSGYGSAYGGSKSRYPYSDYDSGYRYTSYLYGRPSSTTTDNPKSSDSDQGNTASPPQGSSSNRSN